MMYMTIMSMYVKLFKCENLTKILQRHKTCQEMFEPNVVIKMEIIFINHFQGFIGKLGL